MNRLLNLNADLGESFGPWSMGSDAEMVLRNSRVPVLMVREVQS